MEKLNKPLDKYLHRWGLKRTVAERKALQVWPQAAGSKLTGCTRPLTVKEGILFLQVANSSWAQHLTFFKPALIRKLNRLLKGSVIKDIHFQVGNLASIETKSPGTEDGEMALEGAEKEKIREMFADFQGEDIIKEKLTGLMEKELLARKRKAAEGWHPCSRCGTYAPPGSPLCPICKI